MDMDAMIANQQFEGMDQQMDPNQLPNQQMGYDHNQQQENQYKHTYDNIPTDDFQMPPSFEVEIRMQDNQVSPTQFLTNLNYR